MRLVLHLPNPHRASTLDVDDLEAIGVAAEAVGFSGLSASDHPFPVVEPGQPGHHTYDPFVLLGRLGAATREIHLVFSLLVMPYRNPFLTASMLATLDILSRGRVMVGVGSGYLRDEFDALGAPFEQRAAVVEEGVEALRAAWTGGPVDTVGRGYVARGNTLLPGVGPDLRILRGGNGPRAIRHAARSCDGWMPFEAGAALAAAAGTTAATLRNLEDLAARYREELVGHGRHRGDIYFVRTDPRWFREHHRAVDELGRMSDAGVTWLETGSSGRSRGAIIEDLQLVNAIRDEAMSS